MYLVAVVSCCHLMVLINTKHVIFRCSVVRGINCKDSGFGWLQFDCALTKEEFSSDYISSEMWRHAFWRTDGLESPVPLASEMFRAEGGVRPSAGQRWAEVGRSGEHRNTSPPRPWVTPPPPPAASLRQDMCAWWSFFFFWAEPGTKMGHATCARQPEASHRGRPRKFIPKISHFPAQGSWVPPFRCNQRVKSP